MVMTARTKSRKSPSRLSRIERRIVKLDRRFVLKVPGPGRIKRLPSQDRQVDDCFDSLAMTHRGRCTRAVACDEIALKPPEPALCEPGFSRMTGTGASGDRWQGWEKRDP